MKFLVACVLSLSFYASNILAGEINDYPLNKIANNTYVVYGSLESPNKNNKGFINNPGFVVTMTGVVVVDPGSSVYVGRMLLKKIKSVTTKPVTHVFNTHIHGDHWLGNQAFEEAFPNVVILAHPEMIKRAEAGGAESWVSLMLQLTAGETKGTHAVIPNKEVNDNQILNIGGVHFRIYAPQQAHSFTDIMIEVVEESVMFLGDNVLYKRMPRMDEGTFLGNIAACQIALDRDVKIYVPGHGISGGKNIVEPFMNYLKIIYSDVSKYYEAGLTDFEMKPKILLKLKSYKDWFGFKHEMGKHVSLAVLEYEKNSF